MLPRIFFTRGGSEFEACPLPNKDLRDPKVVLVYYVSTVYTTRYGCFECFQYFFHTRPPHGKRDRLPRTSIRN
jgi:hypothetical protein